MLKGRRAPGFSLIELSISLLLLSLLLILVFVAFGMSTRLISETTTRQSAENQLNSIRVLLERDLELTNAWYLLALNRQLGENVRDAMAMVALDDWNLPSNLETHSKRPRWNRYIVWYATQQEPGKLIRQVIEADPAPNSFLRVPYKELSENLNEIAPELNQDVVHSRTLSERVLDFEVLPRLQNGSVRVRVRLFNEGQARALSGTKIEDHLEATMIFQPKNTWPEI